MGKTYCFMRKGVERHIFSYENGTIKNDKQKTTQFKEKIASTRKNPQLFGGTITKGSCGFGN